MGAFKLGCGIVLALSAALVGCGAEEDTPFDWRIPDTFPRPEVPEGNPMTEARFELGRHLFYDLRLSGNGTMACASCHRQAHSFADMVPTPSGSTGDPHTRNAPTLINAGYASSLTWASPLLDRLEDQIKIPMFGEAPVELGISGHEAEVLARLNGDPIYQRLFEDAFGTAGPMDFDHVIEALACFVRTLIAADSPVDRYVYGRDLDALSSAALRGMDLFFSERLECHHCHGGFNFTASTTHAGSTFVERRWHNTGLYNVDGAGGYPARDVGLMAVTHDPADMGRFKAPTLRNVALTAPYMHDGSVETLSEVIDHYAAGGRHLTDGPDAGDGRLSPLKSSFITGFELSEGEKADLVAFLEALTDRRVIDDPRYASPWPAP